MEATYCLGNEIDICRMFDQYLYKRSENLDVSLSVPHTFHSNNYDMNDQTFHTPSFGDEDFDIPVLQHHQQQVQQSQQNMQNYQPQQLQQMQPLSSPESIMSHDPNAGYQQQIYMSNDHQMQMNQGYGAPPPQNQYNNQQILMIQQQQQQNHQQQMNQHVMMQQQGQQMPQYGRSPQGARGNTSPPAPTGQEPTTSEDSDDSTPHPNVVTGIKRPSPEPEVVTKVQKKPKVQKKKKKRDPNEPQKPVSAYALFFRDTQAAIKGQNPNASFGEVSKIVASMWDALDSEHKNVYKKKTEAAKKEYLKALAAYRASLVSKGANENENVYGNYPNYQPPPPQSQSNQYNQYNQQQQQNQQIQQNSNGNNVNQNQINKNKMNMSPMNGQPQMTSPHQSPMNQTMLGHQSPMNQAMNQPHMNQQHMGPQSHMNMNQGGQNSYVQQVPQGVQVPHQMPLHMSPNTEHHHVSTSPPIGGPPSVGPPGPGPSPISTPHPQSPPQIIQGPPQMGTQNSIPQQSMVQQPNIVPHSPNMVPQSPNMVPHSPNMIQNNMGHHSPNQNMGQPQQNMGQPPQNMGQQNNQNMGQGPPMGQVQGPPMGQNQGPMGQQQQNMGPQGQQRQGGACIRHGCPNAAIANAEWEDEYCSNECVVSHCRDVFSTWVASNQNPPQNFSTVK